MDYQFSKEQRDIKSAAREFAEKEFKEVARELDLKEEFPFDVWKKACRLGWWVALFLRNTVVRDMA